MVPQWGRWHPLQLLAIQSNTLLMEIQTQSPIKEWIVCAACLTARLSIRTPSEISENKRKINAFNKILRSSLQELKWQAKWTESPRWWRIESTFCPFVFGMRLVTARQVSIAPKRSKEGFAAYQVQLLFMEFKASGDKKAEKRCGEVKNKWSQRLCEL